MGAYNIIIRINHWICKRCICWFIFNIQVKISIGVYWSHRIYLDSLFVNVCTSLFRFKTNTRFSYIWYFLGIYSRFIRNCFNKWRNRNLPCISRIGCSVLYWKRLPRASIRNRNCTRLDYLAISNNFNDYLRINFIGFNTEKFHRRKWQEFNTSRTS